MGRVGRVVEDPDAIDAAERRHDGLDHVPAASLADVRDALDEGHARRLYHRRIDEVATPADLR
jgi:hypothetical protein